MLLDLDQATLSLVLQGLAAKDLASCAASCHDLHTVVTSGYMACKLWRAACEEELGLQTAEMHHAAAVAGAGLNATGYAQFWRRLRGKIATMDEMYWWADGTKALKTSANSVVETSLQPKQGADVGEQARQHLLGQQLKRLSRAGGTATPLGDMVILTGGILREGGKDTDVIIIHLRTLTVTWPAVQGRPPTSRFRHVAREITLLPGSLLHQRLALGLGHDPASGHTILMFGGYNTSGDEFGGNDVEILWLEACANEVVWLSAKTTGNTPGLRFHHCCHTFEEGHKMVLYGGESSRLQSDQEVAVYVLDVNSLTWTCHRATGDGPGPRSLHQSTLRVSPETGHTELVVLSGYANALLADMRPYTLDLANMVWTSHPGQAPPGGPGFSLPLPPGRQRAASYRVSREWLLVHAGSPTEGPFLDDVQRLHLPTLTWAAPVRLYGQPSEGLEMVAGHLIENLLAFGGCVPTAWGITPVTKMDILLVGSEEDYNRQFDTETPAACASSTSEKCESSSDGSPHHIQPKWLEREGTRQCPDNPPGDNEGAGNSKSDGNHLETAGHASSSAASGATSSAVATGSIIWNRPCTADDVREPLAEDHVGLEASTAAGSAGALATQTIVPSKKAGKRTAGNSKEEGHCSAPEQEGGLAIVGGRLSVKQGSSAFTRGHILTMAEPASAALLSGEAGTQDADISTSQQLTLSRSSEDLPAGADTIQGNGSDDNTLEGGHSHGEGGPAPQAEQPERDAFEHSACISLQEPRGWAWVTTSFSQVPDQPELRRSGGPIQKDDASSSTSQIVEDATVSRLGVRGEQPSSRDDGRLLLRDVDGTPVLQEGGLRMSASTLKQRVTHEMGAGVARGESTTDEQAEGSSLSGTQQRVLQGTAERNSMARWRVKMAVLLAWIASLPRDWMVQLMRLVRRWRAQDVRAKGMLP